MQKASSADKDYVLVEHSFEYIAKDGTVVSIKPHERYILLKKTNEHWWQVCQDYKSKPFYIPAKYVKVLSPFSHNYAGMLPASSEETRDVPCTEYSYKFLPARGGANLQRSSIALGAATNSLCDISIIREDLNESKPLLDKKDTGHALGPLRTFQNSKKILDPLKRISYMCPPEFHPSIRPSQSLNDLHAIKSEPPVPSPQRPDIQVKIEQLTIKERHVAGANEDPSSEKVIETEPPEPWQPGIQSEMEQLFIQKRRVVGAKEDLSPEKVIKFEPPVSCPRQLDAQGEMEQLSIQKRYVAEAEGDFCLEKNYTGMFRTSSEKTMEFPSLSARGDANANLQRSSIALGAATRSLCDISVTREDSAEGKHLQDKRDTGHLLGPLRTFQNSQKILDPLKRISYICSPEFQPSIRPSQSLNDLQAIEFEPLVPYPRQPDVQDEIEQLSIQEKHVAGAKGDSSPGKVVNEKEESFYVNLEEFRKDREKPRSSQQLSSSSTLDDWETYTDQGSGQQFYYNSVTGETTWDCPFDQAEEQPISPASLSPASEDSSWEKHFDESSGQFYFHNPVTGETSWDPPAQDDLNPPGGKPVFSPYGSMERRPPTPEADYPEYPAQENVNFPEADYVGIYMSPPYNAPSEELLPGWPYHVKDGLKLYTNNYNGDTFSPPELQRGHSDSNQNNMVITSWRHSNYPTFSPQKDTEVKGLEKAGLLQKSKIVENGKRLRKNWSTSWTVLEGGILTFFRDTKNLSSNSLKQQSLMTVPEHTVKLHGASLNWASKEKSSKKHVMELKTSDGSEYLIHHDSEMITTDWFTSIKKCIGKDARIPSENTSENENESLQEFGSTEKLGMKDEKKGQNTDSDRNVRAKLRKFLQRRPTLQSLRDKGYIRDQVFGCHLHHLCEREKRIVPQFVSTSIQAVEKRGLDIDGLYRVSGNLATIQKLRHKVDHDENFNLEDGKWEDVHVITGALKLFFRELPEPLFPYSHFTDFVEAIKLSDQSQKLHRMRELVLSLPLPNLETMRLLFRHLCSVIEHRDLNRMSVQSVAIVFGPTLLKPAEEGGNIAMYMVFQNQIVEHILNQYKYIFS